MKKNIKFILKLICALLPLFAIILHTVLFPFGYMDTEYPSWKYTKDIINDATNAYTSISEGADGPTAVFVTGKGTPETIILGDSRAMADLVPSEMSGTTVNLAVGGATSIEMYYALETYIKNNGVPENAVIMFAPFHYSIIDNFWTRTAYFNFLSPSQIKDLISYADASNSETIMRKGYKNDLLSYMIRFPDKYLPALINSKFIGRYSENKSTYNTLACNLGYGEFGTADGCSDLNYETNYENMHTTGDAVLLDMYLNRLLKLCSDNKINTILAIPPMNESSYNNLKPSYVIEFSEYLNSLRLVYPAITIDWVIPCYEDKYFGDSSHLNRKGAEKFTKEFQEKYIK